MGPRCVLALLALAQTLRGQSPSQSLQNFVAQQDQTSASTPATPTTPALPQWQDFQVQQFQGDWLVLGLAGNVFRKTDRALLNPFLTTFELNVRGHLEVSNAMARGKRCDTWTYLLIPETQPGHFRVDHRGGRDREDVQVVEGDYSQFALVVSRRHTGSQTILRISLLGRNWYLPSGTMDKFVCLAKRQGLSKDNVVFPDLTDWSPGPHACPG